MTDHRKTAVYIRLSAEDDNVDGRAKKEISWVQLSQISWNMWMTVSAVLILNGRDFNSCRMT